MIDAQPQLAKLDLISQKLTASEFFTAKEKLYQECPDATQWWIRDMDHRFQFYRHEIINLAIHGECARSSKISIRGESISSITEISSLRIESLLLLSNSHSDYMRSLGELIALVSSDNPGTFGSDVVLSSNAGSGDLRDLATWKMSITSFYRKGEGRIFRVHLRRSMDSENTLNNHEKIPQSLLGIVYQHKKLCQVDDEQISITLIGDHDGCLSFIEGVLDTMTLSIIDPALFWYELDRVGYDWTSFAKGTDYEEFPKIWKNREQWWIPRAVIEEYVDPVHCLVSDWDEAEGLFINIAVSGNDWAYELSSPAYKQSRGSIQWLNSLRIYIPNHSKYGDLFCVCSRNGDNYHIALTDMNCADAGYNYEEIDLFGVRFTPPATKNDQTLVGVAQWQAIQLLSCRNNTLTGS